MGAIFGQTFRETIELRIAAALRRSYPYIQAALAYNGELSGEEGIDQVRAAVSGRTPAILVNTGDSTNSSESTSRRRFEEAITVQIYLASTNYRSRLSQTHGDDRLKFGDDPGIYKLEEDVKKALSGWDLELEGLGPLIPRGSQVQSQEPNFSLWLLTMTATIDRVYEERDAARAPALVDIVGRIRFAADEGTLLTGGIGDAELAAVDGVVTLTDPHAAWTPSLVGLEVVIAEANAEDNNGVFVIASVPTATSLTFANRRGASESPFPGTWQIRVTPIVQIILPVEEENA